jgi:hypothetical protein
MTLLTDLYTIWTKGGTDWHWVQTLKWAEYHPGWALHIPFEWSKGWTWKWWAHCLTHWHIITLLTHLSFSLCTLAKVYWQALPF